MIILDILRAILGILFTLFIPGFLLNLILFKKQEWIERITLGIIFSIIIDVFLALFLGLNETMKDITGGITLFNIGLYLIVISIIFLIIFLLKIRKKGLKFDFRDLTEKYQSKEQIEKFFKPRHIILIQFLITLVLVFYLFKRDQGAPVWLFWPILWSNILLTLYSIIKLPKKYKTISLLILEITITSVYVFGLTDSFQMNKDSYFESQYASTIIKNKMWDPTSGSGFAENYYGYNPLLHFVLAFLSLTTNLTTYFISKYILIFLLRCLIILLVYLIVSELIDNNRRNIAHLATFIYISAHGVILIFISRRFIAAIFMLFAIYTLLRSQKSIKKKYWIILFYISSLFIILGDHSTSYLFLLFLLLIWVLYELIFKSLLNKRKDKIISLISFKDVFFVFLVFFCWIIIAGNVFIQQDTSYMSNTINFIIKNGPESVHNTVDFGIKNVFSMFSTIFGDKSVINDEFSETYTSQDNTPINDSSGLIVHNQIGMPINQGSSGVHINYFYENVIAYTSQFVFLSLGFLGFLLVLKDYKNNKKPHKKLSNNQSSTPFIIIFGIFGIFAFIISGFLIRTNLSVFTSTYFWFFSLPLSIIIALLFERFINKKLFLLISIFIVLLIYTGGLIIDYSPAITNRGPNGGIWLENPKAKNIEIYSSASWLDKESPQDKRCVIGDPNIFDIYSGVYGFKVAGDWWFKRIIFIPRPIIENLLNNPIGLGNYPHSQKCNLNYVIINKQVFYLPNHVLGNPVLEISTLKKIESSSSLNKIYDNKEVLIYNKK